MPKMIKRRPLQNMGVGTYSTSGELIDWTYYDTYTISTSPVVRLFTQSIGQGTPAKTLDKTNMTLGGQIPTKQRLTISKIKLMTKTNDLLGNDSVNAFYRYLNTTTMEFVIPGKDSLITVTLQELMGISSLFGLVPTVAGDNIPLAQPRYHGIFPLNYPIILAENTPFEVRITQHATVAVGEGTLDMDIRIGLNGTLERRS